MSILLNNGSLSIRGGGIVFVHDPNFNTEHLKFLRQHFFEKRVLFLEGPIDDNYINDPSLPFPWPTTPRGLIDMLFYLRSQSDAPVKIIIDSPGGFVHSALNLYDVIMTADLPVYTIARGLTCSAATTILMAGASGHRYIFPESKTMIHLPSDGFRGDHAQLKIQMKEYTKVKDKYISMLARHTGKSAEEIERLIDRDYWMNAQESKDFGLVDHIVENWQELLKV